MFGVCLHGAGVVEGDFATDVIGNQQRAGKGLSVSAKKKIDTLGRLAEIAQVSRQTVDDVKRIRAVLQKKDVLSVARANELYDGLIDGGITIRSALNEVKMASSKYAKVLQASKNASGSFDPGSDAIQEDAHDGFDNRIYCGDVIEKLKELPASCVSLCITSPPYFGIFDETYGNLMQPFKKYEDYLTWLQTVFVECTRLLRDGGRLVVNVDSVLDREDKKDAGSYRYNVFVDFCRIAEQAGLKFREDIVWDKQNVSGRKARYGDPPSRPCIRREHEYLVVFSKGQHTLENITGLPADLNRKEKRDYTLSVWHITPETKKKYSNPYPYPEELCRRLIVLYSWQQDIVLDCFNGSGTTTAVAASLNRRWIGIDLNPTYCDEARNRTLKAAVEGIAREKKARQALRRRLGASKTCSKSVTV